jgi:hypothetical protein
MTDHSLGQRVVDVVRESWIQALAPALAPEHTREAAAVMAAHRHARDEAVRRRRWHCALALATRPYRRSTT